MIKAIKVQKLKLVEIVHNGVSIKKLDGIVDKITKMKINAK